MAFLHAATWKAFKDLCRAENTWSAVLTTAPPAGVPSTTHRVLSSYAPFPPSFAKSVAILFAASHWKLHFISQQASWTNTAFSEASWGWTSYLVTVKGSDWKVNLSTPHCSEEHPKFCCCTWYAEPEMHTHESPPQLFNRRTYSQDAKWWKTTSTGISSKEAVYLKPVGF